MGGALHEEEQLHLAGTLYRQSGNDYYAGLITGDSVLTAAHCDAWDWHWKVSQAGIEFFTNGGAPSEAIRTWPAKGNLETPSPLTEALAPFVDVNADGVYMHTDGDYPLIKGDQAVFWVFNDIGNLHTETGGLALGFEFHAMAYAYAIDGTDVDYATYYQYTMVNKSEHDYHDLYLGHFLDIDLGNGADDHIGVDVARKTVFGYNGDDFDEGLTRYGNNIPMVGVRVNRAPDDATMHAAHYFESSTINNHRLPSIAIEYYNYLSGLNPDGSTKTDLNGDPTTYVLDGANLASPSMCADGFLPADYRALQSYGPYDFERSQSMGITYSVVLDFDSAFQGQGCPDYVPFGNAADVVDSRYQFTRCDDFAVDVTADIQDASLDQAGWINLVSLGVEGVYTYDWSNGASTRNIDGISGGPYTVTITNADGCTHTESFEVLDGPGGLNEFNTSMIELFPNPTNGLLAVKGLEVARPYTISNLLGAVVSSGNVKSSLDVHSLPSGIYILKVDGHAPMKFQKID